ncbi:CALS7, partial [Symbiodinium pilosum]
SLFFSKISAGSVGIIRSRDNHLLCERIGVLHSLSFYFTSVAFYVSNLLIDFSITLYVTLFIVFTL